jgi:pimeloyl-ACP methyl ester carboxylesterase
MEGWDRGMWRAMFELYRDADPEKLEAAGRDLGKLTGPSLIIWGDDEPYVPSRFADLYAEALGGQATVEHISPAGHWPWLDQPEVIDRVVGFLSPQPAQ